MKQKLLKNIHFIVTFNDGEEMFSDCDILVEGPAIKQIGPNLSVGANPRRLIVKV